MKLPPVAWSIVQQFGRQGINLGVFALLALLLPPREIGILGAATVWMGFALVFTELGFGAALIQRPLLTPQHLSSVFFVNLALGAALALVGVILAGPFTLLMGLPEAAPMLWVLSGIFITDAMAITQIALAQRELRFRDLAIRDVTASLAGGISGIGVALLGYGAWSIVARALVTSLVELILIWALSPWRPRLSEASRIAIAELWGYSSRIFAFSLLKQSLQNVDKLVVGATLGPVVLGLYTFAYWLVIMPVSSLVGAVGSFLFPKFAQIQADPKRLGETYLLVTRTLVSVLLPALAALAIVAPVLVPGVFGSVWSSAVPLVQLLAIVAVLQTLISPSGQLMKALNRPGWLLKWSIGFGLVTIGAISVGSFWGASGVGTGLVVANLIGLPVIHCINQRLIGVSVPVMLGAIAPASLGTFMLGALTWAAMRFGTDSAMLSAIIGVVAGTPIYIMLLSRLDRSLFTTLLKGLRDARA
ncbi:MAG: lipopolysaccharide biosynthesis protein [Chloroflexaceae bacterium]